MVQPVAFIIGAGSRVGTAVAKKLAEEGYKVAFGSRKPNKDKITESGFFPVTIDASEPESIKAAFVLVKKELGTPSVVIYNAGSFDPPPAAHDPLSLPNDIFTTSASVGLGVFTAAQLALPGFRSLAHTSSPKVFIVTGNVLPFNPLQSVIHFPMSMQKSIATRLVQCFARAYASEGIRFYYASLVSNKGTPPGADFPRSAATHAQVYWELINRENQGNWDHRFTLDGKKFRGYD